MFGDANSLAGNRKTFAFLTKFLSDIMPYEAAVYLKVSVNMLYNSYLDDTF